MLSKNNKELLLKQYFRAARVRLIADLRKAAGEKNISEYWQGAENEIGIILYNFGIKKEYNSIRKYFNEWDTKGMEAISRGTPTDLNILIDKLYQLQYADYKKEVL